MTMQEILDYIEEHLAAALTATELAQKAGYSVYYFYRIFQNEVGMPVMQYITRRKLLAALRSISTGESVTEAALHYGFATHSGFFRAFVKEFGVSPTDYIKHHPLPNHYQVQLKKERFKFMHPNYIENLLANWNLEAKNVVPAYQPNGQALSEHVWQINADYYLKMFENEKSFQKGVTITKQIIDGQTIELTINGKEFVEKNGNFFVLFSKANGQPIFSETILQQSESGRYLGEIIGQITLQLENVTGDFTENNLLETVTNWAMPKSQTMINLSTTWQNTFQKQMDELFPKLPKQVIHRDLHGGNLLVAANSFTVIDFDLAEINFRIYDPCYYLTSVLSEQIMTENFDGEKWLVLMKELLIGYHQVVKLTDAEKTAIPIVMLANQFICVAYFSDYQKYAHLVEVNKKMTLWLIENLAELKEIVTSI